MLTGTRSGSILLFHNDLANTTEALPDILTQLRDKGFEFVTVSDLIYHEDYTIDSNGKQVPISKSSLDINADNVEAVMAQYADEIAAAGFSEEQLAQAAEAIKAGGELPEEVMAVIAQVTIRSETAQEAESSEQDIIIESTK